jgi:hypothetical protein
MDDARRERERSAEAEPRPGPLAGDPDAKTAQDAAVDEMERESFPASDAPSTWAGPEAGSA